MRVLVVTISIVVLAIVAALHLFVWQPAIWLLIIVMPLVAIGLYDIIQKKHALLRLYPIIGHGRYFSDWLRPKIYQYFVEPDYDGRPFNRINRSLVYRRAKRNVDTVPFGTQLNVYDEGYEWMNHSLRAISAHELDPDPRVTIGGETCQQPYSASLLNISAMSFGSLSKNAIRALNSGAQKGNFAHNTGEGSISPYHLEHHGDLVWQIGTGYFGCRDADGHFNPVLFEKNAHRPEVKMIEVKLSQGAKPGHGGILPGRKVTAEIAKIRTIEQGQDVISPPRHSAFSTPRELLNFLQILREKSGGKPVGFKICIGHKCEFLAICKAMIATEILPDFISVDGGEGGTGAAPVEFSNSVGMPFKDGVAFAFNALEGFGLKQHIKIISSGKIVSGFDMYRALALGADLCNSARAMMMAIGCIQALECNTNTCPTGVATQDPRRYRALVVSNKSERVYAYHKQTITGFVELLAASGLRSHDEINRSHIYRRVEMDRHARYDELYPYLNIGTLLKEKDIPKKWRADMALATTDSFMLAQPLTRKHL